MKHHYWFNWIVIISMLLPHAMWSLPQPARAHEAPPLLPPPQAEGMSMPLPPMAAPMGMALRPQFVLTPTQSMPAQNGVGFPLAGTVAVTNSNVNASASLVVYSMQQGRVTSTVSLVGNMLQQLPPLGDFKPGEFVQATLKTATDSYSWQFYANSTSGLGTFSGIVNSELGNSPSNDIAMGDIDQDDNLDIFVARNGGNLIWRNRGNELGQFETTPLQQNMGNADSRGVALGDLDGDGDLDAFVANFGPNGVWLNQGGTMVSSGQVGNADSLEVALGDMDGDGDLDAVIANIENQENRVWLNNGNGTFTDGGVIGDETTTQGRTEGIAVGDFNNDGYLDVLLAHSDGVPDDEIWINEGQAQFEANGQRLVSTGNTGSYGVAVGDLNGDGYLDAAIAKGDPDSLSFSEIWLNNGPSRNYHIGIPSGQSETNYTNHQRLFPPVKTHDVHLTDLDQDDKLDLIVALTGGSRDLNGYPNRVWKNIAPLPESYPLSEDVTVFEIQDEFMGAQLTKSEAIGVGDVDSDGDVDIVFANQGPDGLWLNRNDLEVVSTQPPVPDFGLLLLDPQGLEDPGTIPVQVTFNEPAKPDTIGSQTFRVWGEQTGVYTGTFNRFAGDRIYQFLLSANRFKTGEQIFVGMTTGIESQDDIPLRNPYIWQFFVNAQQGSGVFNITQTLANNRDMSGAVLADFDFDATHDLDMIVTKDGSTNDYWRNDDGLFVRDSSINVGSDSNGVIVADFDLDENTDALLIRDGNNQIIYNVVADNGPQDISQNANSLDAAVGDFNHDGNFDFIVANGAGDSDRVWINDGTGQFTVNNSQVLTNSTGESRAVAVGDLNSDGFMDAVFVGPNGNRVWLGNGGGDFVFNDLPVYNLGDGSNSTDVALADLDNDDDLDIFITNDGSADQVWLNAGTATGSFPSPTTIIGSENDRSQSVALGDYDGDARLDAFIAVQGGLNKLWLNHLRKSARNFVPGQPLNQNNSLFNSQFAIAGDIDNDGDIDVVVTQLNQAAQVWENIPYPELTINKSAPAVVASGEAIEYTITVNNVGNGTANNLVITEVIPSGVSHATLNPGQELIYNTGNNLDLIELPQDTSLSVSFIVTASENVTQVINDQYQVIAEEFAIPISGETLVETEVQVPIESVSISGPTSEFVQVAYEFTATVEPNIAYRPITFTWQSVGSDQADATPIASKVNALNSVIALSWEQPATKTIIVTAENVVNGQPVVQTAIHEIFLTERPPEAISLSGPTSGVVGGQYEFTADVIPDSTTMPLTYTWTATDYPTATVRLLRSRSDNLDLTWDTPGQKVITVSAENFGGKAITTHQIAIYVPPSNPVITPPNVTEGVANQPYTFTAGVSSTSTLPITVVWEATNQQPITQINNSDYSSDQSFTWGQGQSGPQIITVTISNPGGSRVITYSFNVAVTPPRSIAISSGGLISGMIQTAYSFTASVGGPDTTLPVTYTWQATTIPTPTIKSGNLTDTLDLAWATSGRQLITVTAANRGGAISTTYAFTTTQFDVCQPVSEVSLSRLPTGRLTDDTMVLFEVNAQGLRPLSYQWAVDGTPVTNNRSTLLRRLSIGDHLIEATVTGCENSQGSTTMAVTVAASPPSEPNLSQSYKLVDTTALATGDRLTYTIMLRNESNAPAATVIVNDPLPAGTAYVDGSAQALNNAIQPAMVEGAFRWTGPVISGTPVMLQFAVTVNGQQPTAIENIATVTDSGTGNESLLIARTATNNGYSLRINDGALFTNLPTVTLNYQWDDTISTERVRFSNDGGFNQADDSPWVIPTGTYAPWLLRTGENELVPRSVYARFRNVLGEQFGPVQDTIIYDATPPMVQPVQLITTAGRSNIEAAQITLRVTAEDNNSGVDEIHVSTDPDFATFDSFPATGLTTDILGLTMADEGLSIRVQDRAGNVALAGIAPSQVSIAEPQRNGSAFDFTATVSTSSTSRPLTYTWQASGLAPQVVAASPLLTSTVTYTWPTSARGSQTITVTAENAGGTVQDVYMFDLSSNVYLPILNK